MVCIKTEEGLNVDSNRPRKELTGTLNFMPQKQLEQGSLPKPGEEAVERGRDRYRKEKGGGKEVHSCSVREQRRELEKEQAE